MADPFDNCKLSLWFSRKLPTQEHLWIDKHHLFHLFMISYGLVSNLCNGASYHLKINIYSWREVVWNYCWNSPASLWDLYLRRKWMKHLESDLISVQCLPQNNGVRPLSLAGHVGFDSLPDQLVNKSICQGFCFNILCIGTRLSSTIHYWNTDMQWIKWMRICLQLTWFTWTRINIVYMSTRIHSSCQIL